ncbi:MAG TPA: DUF6351 family protein [Nevskiaceae bacterium]|nr:DUF6351 family protein [Nevskiaceae bacterium]
MQALGMQRSAWALALTASLGLAACGSGTNGSATVQASAATAVKVGQVGPIAANNLLQQPFACVTQDTPLGQPVVDNQDGEGLPVTNSDDKVIGYSANCGAPMKVLYFYRATGDADDAALRPYDPSKPPTDVERIMVNGQPVPFIVRFEVGTINRFIYSISSLAPSPDVSDPGKPDESAWNHNLVFYFIGGVGIGHEQSHKGNATRAVSVPGEQTGATALLEKGYAIINSTGAATSTTYNLKLTGQTAKMVKQQFVAEFGAPKYTFGLGGSGGAIQQLIYAQDDPSLLNGLVPIQPFQDMVTQVNPVGDCELLDYFFDVTDPQVNGTGKPDPEWHTWANRQNLVGLHAIDLPSMSAVAAADKTAAGVLTLEQALAPGAPGPGTSVCQTQWFGAVPEFFNPSWLVGGTGDAYNVIPPAIVSSTPFSFFDDLEPIFGTIPGTDLARSTFDNVGVQYGLEALREGLITPAEFLEVNAHVGGWKPRQDMLPPIYPFVGDDLPASPSIAPGKQNVDPWSDRNGTAQANLAPTDIAPRTEGSIPAMQAAYTDGLVFGGNIKQPIIIIQPYLEPDLNEHASRESFGVRQRMIDATGNADNLAIWMIGSGSDAQETQFAIQAIEDETQWLDSGTRPASVQNGCYSATAGPDSPIAQGPGIFKGETEVLANGLVGVPLKRNAADEGTCTQQYPIFSDARVIAGDDVGEQVVFKCALKPVATALTDGTYGSVSFTGAQQTELEDIFPQGVCDYTKPDQGLPAGWTGPGSYPGPAGS